MKIYILCALLVAVAADVSHILQEDGYHYSAPSKPFPPPVVDIPAATTTSQLYLPPRQQIITPAPIKHIVPVAPIHHAASTVTLVKKPALVPAKYLPPVAPAPIRQVYQPTVQVQTIVRNPVIPVSLPKPQPTLAPVVPISYPKPTYAPVIHKVSTVAPVIVPRPTIQQSIVVPSAAPVIKYLPPAPVIPVARPTPLPITPRPQIVYQPTPQPQTLQPVFEHVPTNSVNVEHQGYVYNNNPQPPFSF